MLKHKVGDKLSVNRAVSQNTVTTEIYHGLRGGLELGREPSEIFYLATSFSFLGETFYCPVK